MKPNTLNSLTLILLISLAATVAGVARTARQQGEGRPLRREVNAYFQANVLPVLRQQRQKLEPQLAVTDRAQLAAYRTQLQALKAQGQTLRHSTTPAGTTAPAGPRPVLTDAQQQQGQQIRSQARTIMLNVALMAQKYEAPIRELAQEVQPQKERWTADIKNIMAKNATPEQQGKRAAWGGPVREHGGPRRFFKPAMFLLMDPNAPAIGNNGPDLGTAASFYPNPVAATSQLEYAVKYAGPVTVDLLDSNGNKLRTLLAETAAETGVHRQQLDFSDLPAGVYFFKITTKSGSETKRFVKG